jgi:hypothetical protein
MELLATQDIDEISMDHDLGAKLTGFSSLDMYLRGESKEEDGTELAKWMCEREFLPETIWIHSHNPDGADRMRKIFRDHGKTAIIMPFSALNYEGYMEMLEALDNG